MATNIQLCANAGLELQQQYTNYKNNLQQLAQKIGDVEQDAEEHKYGLLLHCPYSHDLPSMTVGMVDN